MTVDKLCSFLCARLEKIKIIKICSYFIRMLRLSEKVWMYFTFHIQIYKLSHPKNVYFRCWLNRIICKIIFPLTPCILWCRLLSMACSTIISCMFNLMIVMCSPEIVSVFVHVFDLKFLHFKFLSCYNLDMMCYIEHWLKDML